jgi:hypothetical protein
LRALRTAPRWWLGPPHWRDISTGARHVGINSAVGYEILGKTLLGVPERIATVL